MINIDPAKFAACEPWQRDAIIARTAWLEKARPKQITPPGDWTQWFLMGGRGVGKTRTGAEDMGWWALSNPGSRLAIVAPTAADARDTCVEGVSGLINTLPSSAVRAWNRSLGELVLVNDSRFKCFSSEEPDRLRGPQHHRVWCDELGAWRYDEDTWDNMIFGLRLGTLPQVLITTTPRPTALIRRILKDPKTIKTTESTFANEANLAPSVMKAFRDRYMGTRLGRQELEAELLDDAPGALWRRAQLDDTRVKEGDKLPDMQRVVVAVDPAVADAELLKEGNAETGIIVAGLGIDGRGYVLSDLSCRVSPDAWARRAISGVDLYDGDAVVAETNQGGELVKQTIRAVRPTIKVIGVHASRGKVTRAEPISALYEQGRISHVGSFPQLEDQMVAFTSAGIVGGTTGDRVDALVWAFTELFPKMTRKGDAIKNLKAIGVKEYQPHNW